MTPSRAIFLSAAVLLSSCATWSGNEAPFGRAVENMHTVQAVKPPVVTIPMEPLATDGRKVSQALEVYRGKDEQNSGGISLGDLGIGR